MSQKFRKNFKFIRKIDEGTFGQVYQVINIKTNQQFAVKLESINSNHPGFRQECKIYRFLHTDIKVLDKGIPNTHYRFTEGDYNGLVMDLLGPSLQSLFKRILTKFSLKTVLMLIDQMISRVQYLHKRHLLHRDIKPDNFCIGLNNTAHKIFILDFGLAKLSIRRDGSHIPYREGESFVGTELFASINAHLGIQQSYRDDMESIGYSAMYLLRGMLPWQFVQASSQQEYKKQVKQKKSGTSIQDLCKGYPVEFSKYISQCRELGFGDRPPYSAMKAMFRDLFQRKGYQYDYKYDWVILSEKNENMQKKEESLKDKNKQISIQDLKKLFIYT